MARRGIAKQKLEALLQTLPTGRLSAEMEVIVAALKAAKGSVYEKEIITLLGKDEFKDKIKTLGATKLSILPIKDADGKLLFRILTDGPAGKQEFVMDVDGREIDITSYAARDSESHAMHYPHIDTTTYAVDHKSAERRELKEEDKTPALLNAQARGVLAEMNDLNTNPADMSAAYESAKIKNIPVTRDDALNAFTTKAVAAVTGGEDELAGKLINAHPDFRDKVVEEVVNNVLQPGMDSIATLDAFKSMQARALMVGVSLGTDKVFHDSQTKLDDIDALSQEDVLNAAGIVKEMDSTFLLDGKLKAAMYRNIDSLSSMRELAQLKIAADNAGLANAAIATYGLETLIANKISLLPASGSVVVGYATMLCEVAYEILGESSRNEVKSAVVAKFKKEIGTIIGSDTSSGNELSLMFSVSQEMGSTNDFIGSLSDAVAVAANPGYDESVPVMRARNPGITAYMTALGAVKLAVKDVNITNSGKPLAIIGAKRDLLVTQLRAIGVMIGVNDTIGDRIIRLADVLSVREPYDSLANMAREALKKIYNTGAEEVESPESVLIKNQANLQSDLEAAKTEGKIKLVFDGAVLGSLPKELVGVVGKVLAGAVAVGDSARFGWLLDAAPQESRDAIREAAKVKLVEDMLKMEGGLFSTNIVNARDLFDKAKALKIDIGDATFAALEAGLAAIFADPSAHAINKGWGVVAVTKSDLTQLFDIADAIREREKFKELVEQQALVRRVELAKAPGDNTKNITDLDGLLDVSKIVLPPVVDNDVYSIPSGKVLDKKISVLGNDINTTKGELTVKNIGVFKSAKDGTVAMKADGTFKYTPKPGFTGTDSFTYIAVNAQNAESDPGIVTITVTNDPPVANDDPIDPIDYSVQIGQTLLATKSVLDNDKDDNGDKLKVVKTGRIMTKGGGFVDMKEDGTYTYDTTTLPAGFTGATDSFTYEAVDIHEAESNEATVTIHLKPRVAPKSTGAQICPGFDRDQFAGEVYWYNQELGYGVTARTALQEVATAPQASWEKVFKQAPKSAPCRIDKNKYCTSGITSKKEQRDVEKIKKVINTFILENTHFTAEAKAAILSKVDGNTECSISAIKEWCSKSTNSDAKYELLCGTDSAEIAVDQHVKDLVGVMFADNSQ